MQTVEDEEVLEELYTELSEHEVLLAGLVAHIEDEGLAGSITERLVQRGSRLMEIACDESRPDGARAGVQKALANMVRSMEHHAWALSGEKGPPPWSAAYGKKHGGDGGGAGDTGGGDGNGDGPGGDGNGDGPGGDGNGDGAGGDGNGGDGSNGDGTGNDDSGDNTGEIDVTGTTADTDTTRPGNGNPGHGNNGNNGGNGNRGNGHGKAGAPGQLKKQ